MLKEISDWTRCLEKPPGNEKHNLDDEAESGKVWKEKPGQISVRHWSKEHGEKEISSVNSDELIGILFQI